MGTTANQGWPYPESSDFVADGATAIENLADAIDGSIGTGYTYVQTVYFTSSGTFTKASYPWLRAVRVRVQGAGGGSAGDSSIYMTPPGAGGGGGYSEEWILEASLPASVTVTVGAGGSAGGAGGAGGGGGTSDFVGFCYATGGVGGADNPNGAEGGFGGVGVNGDLNIYGQPGGNGSRFFYAPAPAGGSSVLGGGGRGGQMLASGENGYPGNLYGGGAGAPFPRGTMGYAGAAGADGIVIVELYA